MPPKLCPFCGKELSGNPRVCSHCYKGLRARSREDRIEEAAGMLFEISIGATWFLGSMTCAMHENPDGTQPWMRQNADAIILSLWGVTILTGFLWWFARQRARG